MPSAPTRYPRAPLYFSLLLLLAVAGFYPSYFGRLRSADAVHHAHGIAATLWMLLLIAQSWLIGRSRRRAHRILGWSSLILVAFFLLSGLGVIHAMVASAGPFSARYGARLAFVDLVSLIFFAGAYGLALARRKDAALHMRLMASTAPLLIPPALSRLLANTLPAIHTFETAFQLSFLAAELVALALILDDRRQGRVRAPYPALLAALVLEHAGFFLVAAWPAWGQLMARAFHG
ncbi:MAG TPA: hypothetical protein VFT46_07760 [Holophagaceae bacterium]|nr:hypothetical protein [Holophagaceae bacterium]